MDAYLEIKTKLIKNLTLSVRSIVFERQCDTFKSKCINNCVRDIKYTDQTDFNVKLLFQ